MLRFGNSDMRAVVVLFQMSDSCVRKIHERTLLIQGVDYGQFDPQPEADARHCFRTLADLSRSSSNASATVDGFITPRRNRCHRAKAFGVVAGRAVVGCCRDGQGDTPLRLEQSARTCAQRAWPCD